MGATRAAARLLVEMHPLALGDELLGSGRLAAGLWADAGRSGVRLGRRSLDSRGVPGASFSVAGGRFSVAGGRASVDMLEEACYRYWEGAKSANFFFNELFINASAHTPDTHI